MTRLTQRPWFGALRDAALVLVLVLGIRAYQTRDAPTGVAPQVSATMLDGSQLDLTRYRGAPVLVHFWATWCHVCALERSNIVSVAHDLPVVTIASRSGTLDAVRAFAREQEIAFPVAIDADAGVAARFGVRAFPTTFVLDADGIIRSVEPGYTTEFGLRMRMWWASL